MITDSVEVALKAIKEGKLVAIPTETVYGLGADADNPNAVLRIFEAKQRPLHHPLIVHIECALRLKEWGANLSDTAWALAEAFWPGPLTLVVERAPRALDVVTGGLPTVAVRVPDHPLTLAVLKQFGGGIAAPSANRFTHVSPTCAAHVHDELGEDVDVILDGGSSEVGLESTIVDVSGDTFALLRPGGVSVEALEDTMGRPIDVPLSPLTRAPGQHALHYAPQATVRVVDAADVPIVASALESEGRKVAILPSNASPEFARVLYARLRACDADGVDIILVTLPSQEGLGRAIADRLQKAAGPR